MWIRSQSGDVLFDATGRAFAIRDKVSVVCSDSIDKGTSVVIGRYSSYAKARDALDKLYAELERGVWVDKVGNEPYRYYSTSVFEMPQDIVISQGVAGNYNQSGAATDKADKGKVLMARIKELYLGSKCGNRNHCAKFDTCTDCYADFLDRCNSIIKEALQ